MPAPCGLHLHANISEVTPAAVGRTWLVMLVEVVKAETAASGAGSAAVKALKRQLFDKLLAALQDVVKSADAGRRGADVLPGA
jgi:hypothetical protein